MEGCFDNIRLFQGTSPKSDGTYVTRMPVDADPFPSLSRSFIFRDKAFASPSAALEAYINSELGQGSFHKKGEDVENLLTTKTTNGSLKKDHGGARRKTTSVSQMVDEAYKQLQQIKKKRKLGEIF